MLPHFRALADGREESKPLTNCWDLWLSSHLLVYSFLRNRATALPKFTASPKPTEVEILGRYTSADGHNFLMMFFSAVYSSRRAIGRANQSIEQARNLGERSHVPIVLINDGLPVDPR